MVAVTQNSTWELKAIRKALSIHPWLNTAAEQQRLADVKNELRRRVQSKLAGVHIRQGLRLMKKQKSVLQRGAKP
jgi:predicted deacylase|tara:strand:- start:2 stop:226 length:225 start_codon:yes stop_codon:yes gene_type:complete